MVLKPAKAAGRSATPLQTRKEPLCEAPFITVYSIFVFEGGAVNML